MKTIYLTIFLSILSSIVLAFSSQAFRPAESTIPLTIKVNGIVLETQPLEVEDIKPKTNSHKDFLYDLGHRESTNNYKAVNQFGYLGRYQFGRQTLNNLGYEDISNREFLSSPNIQEAAMRDLLEHNKKILKKYIQNYDGKVINGVFITESGILAAAHLAGPGNVKKFFKKGYEFKDGNGTTMTSYMKKFANYKLNL